MINRTHVWFAAFVVILFAAGVASGVALDRAMGWGQRRPGIGFRNGQGGPGVGNPGGPNAPGNRGMGGPGARGGQPGGPPTEAFVNELDQALTLTADQKTKITAIIDASRPRLRALQDDASKRFSAEQQTMTEQITKVLTPEQATKLEAFQQSHRGGPFGGRGRGGRVR